MHKKILVILLVIMMTIMSSCAKKSSELTKGNYATPGMPSPSSDSSYNGVSEGKAEYSISTNQSTIPLEKKIIQNFQVNIMADDIRKAAKEIGNKTKALGGYTEAEDINEYGSNTVVRIPAQNADFFIEYLEKEFEVTNKNKNIEDVTDAYVDNDARLKNLRAEEAQVLEIMKKANTVEEILKVQSELFRIREEIEVLDSRKKNWDRQVDYSTVRLSINKKQIVSDNKIKILNSNEFFNSMWQGFSNTFTSLVRSLQTLLIYLFSNLIPIGIIGGLVYGGYKILKKKQNKL